MNRDEVDYLRSKGVTILPDSTDITRLSTAMLGAVDAVDTMRSDGSHGSRDSRRVLLKWYDPSTKVVVCDPKLGERKVYSPTIQMFQLGSILLGRPDNSHSTYHKMDMTGWIESSASSIVCKDVDCCLYRVTLRILCSWRLPLYNDCLYELRSRGDGLKLYKRVSIDRELNLTCQVKSMDNADCGITYYTLDRTNGILYCLNDQRFLKFDLSGNCSNSTVGSDAISAVKLADWKRSPMCVYGFEFCSSSARSNADAVSIVVLSELGFDRYDSKTDRWTYDNHRISGHCSMVAM